MSNGSGVEVNCTNCLVSILTENGYSVTEDWTDGVKRTTFMNGHGGETLMLISGRVSGDYCLDEIGVKNGTSYRMHKPEENSRAGFIGLLVETGILSGDFSTTHFDYCKIHSLG